MGIEGNFLNLMKSIEQLEKEQLTLYLMVKDQRLSPKIRNMVRMSAFTTSY